MAKIESQEEYQFDDFEPMEDDLEPVNNNGLPSVEQVLRERLPRYVYLLEDVLSDLVKHGTTAMFNMVCDEEIDFGDGTRNGSVSDEVRLDFTRLFFEIDSFDFRIA